MDDPYNFALRLCFDSLRSLSIAQGGALLLAFMLCDYDKKRPAPLVSRAMPLSEWSESKGSGGGIRTHDQVVNSHLLCR